MRLVISFLALVASAATATIPMTSAAPSTALRSDAVQEVRELLRVPIPADQRAAYRGITRAATTGVKYRQIMNTNITTPEELIIAEMFGFRCHPADDPDGLYFFSTGRGLIAKYDPLYVQKSIEENGKGPVRKETISELDAMYRESTTADRYTPEELATEVEDTLETVATNYVEWAKSQFGASDLQARQQGYYCNKQGTYCHDNAHCPKTRTIQRSMCECGHYGTCKTEPLPVPPYICHIGSHCID